MRASLRSLLFFALIGTAAAVPAFAQTSGGSTAPLSTYPACAGKPTQADTDAAHGAYMAGKGSFDEADYTTALNYFKDAYRRDCTKHELLVIIARAYELKGDKREAVNALETYLARVPTAQDAEVQKRRIANLKKEIADAPPPVPVVVPSASASTSAAPPASAAPSASAPAPVPSAASTSATSATSAESGGHTLAPWIVVIAGGVVTVAGGALYVVGSGDVSDAEKACGTQHKCPVGDTTSQDKGNTGRSLETVGVIVGGVGLAAVAGGLLWHFLEPTGVKGSTSGSQRPVLAPQLSPGYAGMGVSARF